MQYDTEILYSYFEENQEDFKEKLLNEAVNVRDKIDEILAIGNIDLVNNAHTLVGYIIKGEEEELHKFAKQEGIAWATHDIDLTFKLEWIQAIRRTIWVLIEQYFSKDVVHIHFFKLEKKINTMIDEFLNAFFICYSEYKDSLLKAHRELVEDLSVPIIPISPSVSILPLIGVVDDNRTSILEEKVLTEIGNKRLDTLIIDLSGIANMEAQVIDHLMKTIQGTSLMGCQSIITGLRPEVVRKMVQLGMTFDRFTKTIGTLQQALKEYVTF